MGRFVIFLGLLVLAVAFAVLLLSILRGVYAAGQDMVRPMLQAGERELLAPSGIQKVAYAALLILLFGLTTGLIGGL
ncbi:MAG: hypothetical protein KDK02_05240 [Rhodobacteraceae bacterium]|nr:hypothetical protein [Paracoccaceae bacterium]